MEKHGEREREKSQQQMAKELERFCDFIQAILKAELYGQGYHQHKRGEWRTRRGEQQEHKQMARTTKAQALAQPKAQALAQSNQSLAKSETIIPDDVQRAQSEALIKVPLQGNSEAAVKIWNELREYPDLCAKIIEDYGDMGRQSRLALINNTQGKDEMAKLATRAKLLDMEREVGGATPSPLEALLVQRIVSCWLQLHT